MEVSDLTAGVISELVETLASKYSLRVNYSKPLFSSGQMSSLLAVELLLGLERQFGKKVRSAFNKISDLDSVQLIHSKMKEIERSGFEPQA